MNAQLTNLLFVGVIIAAFWFLIIRPQQAQRRKHDELIASLRPGVRVMTAGGMYGTIVDLDEDSVLIELAEGVNVEFARGAISQVLSDSDIAEGVEANEAEAEAESDEADEPLVGDGSQPSADDDVAGGTTAQDEADA